MSESFLKIFALKCSYTQNFKQKKLISTGIWSSIMSFKLFWTFTWYIIALPDMTVHNMVKTTIHSRVRSRKISFSRDYHVSELRKPHHLRATPKTFRSALYSVLAWMQNEAFLPTFCRFAQAITTQPAWQRDSLKFRIWNSEQASALSNW